MGHEAHRHHLIQILQGAYSGELAAGFAYRGHWKSVKNPEEWVIGRTIGFACHVTGWFLPMYFAGRLESGNVVEYEVAASHAVSLGLREFEADLMVMAGVEKEHELFFASVITGHRLLPLISRLFGWAQISDDERATPPKSHSPEAAD